VSLSDNVRSVALAPRTRRPGTRKYLEQVVRRYYALVDAGDYAAAVQLFAPDAVYCRPGYEPMRGRHQLRSFYEHIRVIESGKHELTTIVAADGVVAVAGTFRGRLRNGRLVRQGFADFFTFEGGSIAARETYFDAAAV
jgi:steroid delta-isomerase